MVLRRFHIPPGNIHEKEALQARLPASEARHLRHVLRIRDGECVEIFDGKGGRWTGEVAFHGEEVFICRLTELAMSPAAQSSPRLVLAMALIKSARFEWALEKATELGVHEFLPLHTSRSEIRISMEKLPNRYSRWERIVTESVKQCRRTDIPQVHLPMEFRDFCITKEYEKFEKIMFYEKSSEPWHPAQSMYLGDTVLCIGPEGGWTEEEIVLAEKSGCRIFSLGGHILRTETAAIAATAVVQLSQVHHV